uniref:uncharacterized protein n=1 Tax=Pristiophorus japonicus TaxID=55135 RepID=UPI00398ED643
MTCVLVIQALLCVTMKRKRQREGFDYVRVLFALSRSGFITSSSAESIWYSVFSCSQTGGGDWLIARSETSAKGQPTSPPALLTPRLWLSLQCEPAMEVTAASERLYPLIPIQPRESSLASFNPQASGSRQSLLPPAPRGGSPASSGARSPSNLKPTFCPGPPGDQGVKTGCDPRGKRWSTVCSAAGSEWPEKESLLHCLMDSQCVLESAPNPSSPGGPNATSGSPDLADSTIEEGTKTSAAPHQLTQKPGICIPSARESQASRQTPNSASRLEGKSLKPSSSLEGCSAGQRSEVLAPTPNPRTTTASSPDAQPKWSPGGYSSGLRSMTGASDQNRLRCKVLEGPFTISHLASSAYVASPGGNGAKGCSMKQSPSLVTAPGHCQRPQLIPVQSPSISSLEGKLETSFPAPNHTRPSECDEFVEIALDEIFPPNPKMLAESRAWSGISEPLSEFWTKIHLSSIFNCFHQPAPTSSNTLSVRVQVEARGSGSGLDTGDVWGKILNVSPSSHTPLPWGKVFADLLFQEFFKPTEILKGTQATPPGGAGRRGQSEHQLPARNSSMTHKDRDTAKCTIPGNKDVHCSPWAIGATIPSLGDRSFPGLPSPV